MASGILVSHVVGKGKRCQVNLINDGNRFAKIKKGTPIGYIEEIYGVEDTNCDDEQHLDIKRGVLEANAKVPSAPPQVELQDLPPHLTDLYQRSIKHPSDTEQRQLKHVLLEYQDVFARHDLDLGCLTVVKHSIDTKDSAPVKHRMRRTPIGIQDLEQQHLDKILKAGVIQPSTSEWASAPVLVRKKDGTVRWCIDYRALNDRTIKDCFPLPIIEDCLDSLQGTTTFSTLDLASGYYQIELEPNDRKKTAFITRYGLFEHTRMGMGLCNAPATFQRAKKLVLRGLTWTQVLVYLDDVVVLGRSFDDGLRNLKAALDRFRKYTLKLKPKKCQLFQPEVEFLGKLVNANGISVAPSKIEAVRQWPVPKSKKEVMSYFGFLNYHRDHIDKFAETTACLYELAHQPGEVEWQQVHDEAFQKSKMALLSAPCLTYPNPHDKFVLDTDASDTCIGAVLSQLQDGRERVLCYASHVLLRPQRRYCTTRKELLAVVKFCRHFRHYLLDRRFILRTDHSSLVWLMRFKHIEGQLSRWLEELATYDMEIVHRPGKRHANADGMSRIPDTVAECDCYLAGKDPSTLPGGGCHYCSRAHQQWSRFEYDVDDVVPSAITSATPLVRIATVEGQDENHVISDLGPSALADSPSKTHCLDDTLPYMDGRPSTNWMGEYQPESLRLLQHEDKDLVPIFKWLNEDLEPSQSELRLHSRATRSLWLCKSCLKIIDGVLLYQFVGCSDRKLCLVVPSALQDEVLRYRHDIKTAGHLGEKKTLEKAKQSFLWYNMRKDCEEYVRTCAVCSQNKKAHVRPRAPLEQFHSGYPNGEGTFGHSGTV